MCNSTFNEVQSGSVSNTGFGIIRSMLWFILTALIGILFELVGIDNFQWQSWYTILVFFGVFILLPALILLFKKVKNE
jgi:hypothetical protein